MRSAEDYQAFLRSKVPVVQGDGFDPPSPCPEWFKPHQRDVCNWAISKGRAALFESFGLGKTVQMLQLAKWVHEHTGGRFLLVAPLGVRHQFIVNDGPRMGMKITYCRTDAEVEAADTPFIITNYERVREGDITPVHFTGAGLDEASGLREYGSKTTQNFVRMFGDVKFLFVATATPSPNDLIELINYADFLRIMDRGQALTRFFQRDSTEAGNLTLYPHEEHNFWLWVASWAVFVTKPSDLGHDDTGYDLPEMNVIWHEVEGDHGKAGDFKDRDGNPLMFSNQKGGIVAVSKNRRKTKDTRISKAAELIRQADPNDHWIIWHYLESEREQITKEIPESVAVYGKQDLEERENHVLDFEAGKIRILSSKPELLGSGCNFQRHCHKAIFIGPTDKFNDFIQAVHRIYRFLQDKPVEIHIIFADTQYDTVVIMKRKWEQHDLLTARMRAILKEHGISGEALRMKFERTMGCTRQEASGKAYRAINNDCVAELYTWPDDCVDEIVTSIPFSDHYEYSPSLNDFGHNQGDGGFFEQFEFLVPQMLRVLRPGRVACIHTKDRIEYGTMTGRGMYSVNEFSDKTVQAMKKHGFVYQGRIVIDTDVVRENDQSYRLGHTENGKDSTKMGCGSNEYVLLFRKWEPSMSPNQTANGPFPVRKTKDEYPIAKWQLDASGTWRSNGNELVSPAQLASMDVSELYNWWRKFAAEHSYDLPTHEFITETIEKQGRLPATMMLVAPVARNPDIWTDIIRIDTLNTDLSRRTSERHVCPLQMDVIERLIRRYSNPGEIILDPFGGIGSVPYVAIRSGRIGWGIELSVPYWQIQVSYCERMEKKLRTPTLFDLPQMQAAMAGGAA